MTETAVTTDATAIAHRYFRAWNAPATQRSAAVAKAYATDAYYCDPFSEATGTEAIAAMIGGVQDQFPGSTFQLGSEPEQHHQQTRFDWVLVDGDGVEQLSGIDVLLSDEVGAVTHALGFFGRTPEPLQPSERHEFLGERTFDATPEEVWAVINDWDLHASAAPNLGSIDGSDARYEGGLRTCSDPDGNEWVETCTRWDEGRAFSFRVHIETYPADKQQLFHAMAGHFSVEEVAPQRTKAAMRFDAELTPAGTELIVDSGLIDQLIEPILDAWEQELS